MREKRRERVNKSRDREINERYISEELKTKRKSQVNSKLNGKRNNKNIYDFFHENMRNKIKEETDLEAIKEIRDN